MVVEARGEALSSKRAQASATVYPYKLAKGVLCLVPCLLGTCYLPLRVAMFVAKSLARRAADYEKVAGCPQAKVVHAADFTSLPDSLQLEILKAVPMVDR